MMNAGHISDFELTKDTRQFAYDAHREHYGITYHLCAPNSVHFPHINRPYTILYRLLYINLNTVFAYYMVMIINYSQSSL